MALPLNDEVDCSEIPAPGTVPDPHVELQRKRLAHLNDWAFQKFLDVVPMFDRYHVLAESRIGQNGRPELCVRVSTEAMRAKVDRTGRYAGQTTPRFLDQRGRWREVWTHPFRPPVAAKVGIRRKGFADPVFAVAHWAETVQGIDTPRGPEADERWTCSPAAMLADAAERFALVRRFPEALSSVAHFDGRAVA